MNLEVQIMDIRDPVCGMLFPPEQAVTATRYGGNTYHFCSQGCRSSFVADPERHIDEGRRRSAYTHGAPTSNATQGRATVQRQPVRAVDDPWQGAGCPYCHEPTLAERGPGGGVEGIRIHELEVLVRNEWRRRLGPESYHRRHPAGLIRGVALCVLHPGSRVIEDELEARMWDEVAELLADAKNRKEIQNELGELVMALRAVLKDNGVSWRRILDLTDPVRMKIEAALGWPGGLAVSVKDWDA